MRVQESLSPTESQGNDAHEHVSFTFTHLYRHDCIRRVCLVIMCIYVCVYICTNICMQQRMWTYGYMIFSLYLYRYMHMHVYVYITCKESRKHIATHIQTLRAHSLDFSMFAFRTGLHVLFLNVWMHFVDLGLFIHTYTHTYARTYIHLHKHIHSYEHDHLFMGNMYTHIHVHVVVRIHMLLVHVQVDAASEKSHPLLVEYIYIYIHTYTDVYIFNVCVWIYMCADPHTCTYTSQGDSAPEQAHASLPPGGVPMATQSTPQHAAPGAMPHQIMIGP